MLNLTKTSISRVIFCKKNANLGMESHVPDAKTDPFIPFGADLFVYLNHIVIQIT